MEKDFDSWNDLKKALQGNEIPPTFAERELWWASIGINLGHEEDGKSEFHSRPVLIVRKFNEHLFIALPLTSVIKENFYYHKIDFQGNEQSVLMSQVKAISSKRLTTKIGSLSYNQFREVRGKLAKIINP